MRNRILAGLLASTLALGLALLAAPTLHADGVAEPDPIVPAVDEPADPVLPDVAVPEEGIELERLAPMAPPRPRFVAGAPYSRLAWAVVVPDAPPRIDVPEPPALDDGLPLEIVFERPELTPVRLAAPAVEASSHC